MRSLAAAFATLAFVSPPAPGPKGLEGVPSPQVAVLAQPRALHLGQTVDGIIHMEAPKQITFNLGQFFDIWGQKLSSTQVGPAHGKVTALVDGKVVKGNPRAIVLKAHELIQLDVGTLVGEQKIGFAQL